MGRWGFVSLAAVTLLVLCASCGGSGRTLPVANLNPAGLPTLGELQAMIDASIAPDTDKDFIPDDVEAGVLGTDPNDPDSDHDGLPDNFEIFGDGLFDPEDFVPDKDFDGIIAPLDKDDDADNVNDGLLVDTDEDGIANYLEVYGYFYDWLTGRFVSVEDVATSGMVTFKSDPLQWSTDQDPYSDAMEASGLMMDVGVQGPGRHPLVPALPNIVVQLEGYQITLNDEITYEEGGSLTEGQSWSRQTERGKSTTHNLSVEVGTEIGYDDGFTAKGHVNVGYGVAWGHTTSTSVATGTSVSEEVNWNKARSHNPTQAARMKLMLKVENRGTAPASNIVPTITLSIGGASVATFRPANLQVNLLMPGEVFPAGEHEHWVFDMTENGPLMLTDWELRALESGAPVRLSVSQVDADVMRMNEIGGWDAVGAVDQHIKRCDAVCAVLFADLGDGAFMHHRVFAMESPSAPVVTLGDALRWTMRATEVGDDVYIEHVLPNGTAEQVKLTEPGGEGWSVHMDKQSFDRLDPLGKVTDLVLAPSSHIEMIPPREVSDVSPTIYSAYAMPLTEGYHVVACAYDRDGIESVVLVDRFDQEHEMRPDGRGPWFFSCNMPGSYEFLGNATEYVKVTSVNSSVATQAFDVEIIHTVESRPPSVSQVIYNESERRLQVRVEPGTSLPQDAIVGGGEVRLYHRDFPADGTTPAGYRVMNPTIYWFEAPDIYEVVLPVNGALDELDEYPGCRIVARSAGGQYTIVNVQDEVATDPPYGYGDFLLDAYVDWDLGVVGLWAPYADLDRPGYHYPKFERRSDGWYYASDGGDYVDVDGSWPGTEHEPFAGLTDETIYYRSSCKYGRATEHRFNFMPGCVGAPLDVPGGQDPEVYFEELVRGTVVTASGAFQNTSTHKLEAGKVYGFETQSGRYGKLYIKTVDPKLSSILWFPNYTRCRVIGRYVIFD
ncbi:MAG: hypothetical protein QNJ98_02480 [Planctomycetota bacterium]|nr:hypothetical protein [Planctomycetota bacterium]